MPLLLRETAGNVTLVATTIAALDAEDREARELAGLLGVLPPASWPPEFNGPETREWMRSVLRAHPDEPGFASWYVVGDGRLCGTAGYKGPPDATGTVEIGYSIVAEDRLKGFALGAVRLLVARAFRDPRVNRVLADTLPGSVGSQAVLAKAGFTRIADRFDPDDGELRCFAITRPG